jgi:hypothetical protein
VTALGPQPPGDWILHHRPAWRRPTVGEHRWPAALAVLVAVALQLSLPTDLAFHPKWLLPGIELVLFLVLILLNPLRINRESRLLRVLGLALTYVVALGTFWSAGALVNALLNHGPGEAPKAPALLLNGAVIWVTNVIVFALAYWEYDRGGPAARAAGRNPYPDFLFTGMTAPELVHPHWEPTFVDYLFLSFTNASAFSPTDTMPLTSRAKILMAVQATAALITSLLVIARAVGALGGGG